MTCTCRTRTAGAWPGAACPRGWRASPASMSWSARMSSEPGEVVIGIETDRGLFVAALVAAGYQVFAVNPMSTSRYRDRHSTSGAKSDPGDAKVLADMVRTDRHNHRPAAADSELAEAVKVLARAHQSMIWSRGRQTNVLRSTLREFYPAALAAFDDLTSGDALEVLRVAPTPALGAALSPAKIAAALRRGGRQRRIDERAAEIQAALRAPQLHGSPRRGRRHGRLGHRHRGGDRHHDRPDRRGWPESSKRVLSSTRTPRWSVPCQDWGPSSAPGCSASSATSRTGMPPPSLARTTPARHPSPGPRAPNASCWPATPATSASPTPSTCGPSPPSPPHPAPARFYDTRRAAGDTHHAALRALGNRLVGILHGCLDHHTPYNETTAWAHRTRPNYQPSRLTLSSRGMSSPAGGLALTQPPLQTHPRPVGRAETGGGVVALFRDADVVVARSPGAGCSPGRRRCCPW